MASASTELLAHLRQELGESAVVRAGHRTTPWTRLGEPPPWSYPKDTAQVAAVLRVCHEMRQPVVPWVG